MKHILRKYWVVLTIVFVWFVFSSPFFLTGRVPYPSTYQVTFFAPWSAYEKFWGPVKNNAMPDVIDQIYPWKYYTMQSLKNGDIPFWNPYSFSGNPHLANFQTAVFSPFNLLYLIFPFVISWSIIVLLQPLVAGIGMHLFMKEMRASGFAQLMSSITFMFCGFIVVWMAYGTLAMAIAFLPLILYGIEKSFRRVSIGSLLPIVIGLVVSFFSGHFQTSLYLFIFIFFYFLLKVIQTRNIRVSFLVFLAIAFGIGISLLQILPSIFFYTNSVRSEIFISGGGIPFHYFVTLFSPDFYGNPITRNDWYGYYAEWASFIGIVPFFLTLIAITSKRSYVSLFFFFTCIVVFLLAIESPILDMLSRLKIPVLSTSTPSRIVVLLSFSLAVLAGLGLDQLKNLLEHRKYKIILPPVLAMTSLLLLIWVILLFFAEIPADKVSLAKKNLFLPTVLFVFLVVFLSLSLWKIKLKIVKATLVFFIILAAFDSLRFVTKWMPFDPANLVFTEVPVLSAIRKYIGFGRVFGNLGTQVDTYYQLSSIEGYDPLYIQRYGEFIRAAKTGDFLPAERSIVHVDRGGKYVNRVLDVLGVNIIFHPNADTNQGWAFPVWADGNRFKKIYQDEKHQLYQNQNALPRAKLFYKYEVIKDSRALIKRFYTDDFDFRSSLLLEEDPLIQENGSKESGTAEIIVYQPNKISIRTQSKVPALLFLSDTYYPKWKVFVNGKLEKIYQANYAFRAVKVPSGESRVTFIYNEFF